MFPQIGVELLGKDGGIYIIADAMSRKAIILLKWDNESGSYKVDGTYVSIPDLVSCVGENFE